MDKDDIIDIIAKAIIVLFTITGTISFLFLAAYAITSGIRLGMGW